MTTLLRVFFETSESSVVEISSSEEVEEALSLFCLNHIHLRDEAEKWKDANRKLAGELLSVAPPLSEGHYLAIVCKDGVVRVYNDKAKCPARVRSEGFAICRTVPVKNIIDGKNKIDSLLPNNIQDGDWDKSMRESIYVFWEDMAMRADKERMLMYGDPRKKDRKEGSYSGDNC